MIDVREVLHDAVPIAPEFDAESIVRTIRSRKRRRSLIVVGLTGATAAVIAVALGLGTRTITTAPQISISPPPTVPAGPPVTTAAGYQSLASVPRLPSSAVHTVALPDVFGGERMVLDGDTLWAAGCSPNSNCAGAASIDLATGATRVLPGSVPDKTVVTRVAAGAGGVFILENRYDGSPYHVVRLDPVTGAVDWTVAVPGTSVQGDPKARLAFGAGALWFSNGTQPIVEFSPADGAVMASIPVPDYIETTGAVGFAFDAQGVWAVGGSDGTDLMNIDPATKHLTVVNRFAAGFTQSLSADGPFLWTTHFTGRLDLARVDAAAPNAAVNVGIPTYNVAAGDGQTWFVGYTPIGQTNDPANDYGTVGRIDPETGRVIATTELQIGALDTVELIVHGGKAYVIDSDAHTLTTITP